MWLLQVPINFGSASKEDWARLEEILTPLEVSIVLLQGSSLRRSCLHGSVAPGCSCIDGDSTQSVCHTTALMQLPVDIAACAPLP